MSLKEKVLEIIEITKQCPEALQAMCFEMLMKHELSTHPPQKPERQKTENHPPENLVGNGDQRVAVEIQESELHTKTRHFMKKYEVTIAHINNLFYKENGSFAPLYEDLKSTKMAESQFRIALLQAFQNALATGDFQTTVEAVRTEASDRKAYDSGNFTRNFSKNSTFFDFDTWDKSISTLRLSEEGRKELAEVIKEIQ